MQERNRILDLVRIVLATSVLISHAFEMIDGSRVREPFVRYTHTGVSLGDIGVDFFFILSGYLIVRSWQMDPHIADYLQKRLLRIAPGFTVAFLGSVVLCGLLAPGVPHFFASLLHGQQAKHFVMSFVTFDEPKTPDVFPAMPYPVPNGPLWTLNYEVRCYLIVALLGVLGLYRFRFAWLSATVALAALFPLQGWLIDHGWSRFTWFFGVAQNDARLLFPFFVGGCFLLYQAKIHFRPLVVASAAVMLVIALLWRVEFEFFLIVLGSYLLFALARIQLPHRGFVARVPDISYGMYIYGWPVEKFCIYYLHPSAWVTVALAIPATAALGVLSWYLLEKPMLALKPRPSVLLPEAA